jgi:hypothetical protein
MPTVRSRRWCFTLNNPTPEENESIRQQMTLLMQASKTQWLPLTYLVFGRECQSTPHLQGYLELSKKTSLSTLKKFLSRAHWEKAKGTSKQASDYCKKDGDFEEAGTLSPGQGTRTDLLDIKNEIDAGASDFEIATKYFNKWLLHRRSFAAYRGLLATKRSWKTKVVVIWGKTGVGKTRFVHDQIMDSTFWTPGDYLWFDGYSGQEIVLFDEFRGQYPISQFLKLTDRYPMTVPIKGGFSNWSPRKIYITSNIKPSIWYHNVADATHQALLRRLDIIHQVNEPIY